MPQLKALVEHRVGPVTYSEIAEALASAEVSGREPGWREEWAELIETLKRAALAPRTERPRVPDPAY
jgi:hypothetical protein